MNRTEIRKTLDTLVPAIAEVSDPKMAAILQTLLNIIEALMAENEKHLQTIQQLRDENNRLKGEQGKPTVRKQSDHSSEEERKERENKSPRHPKKPRQVSIDRRVDCPIDKTRLLVDAIFKGYETVVVQDVVIKTDNIAFRKEVYYSPSLKKTLMSDLPAGYHGAYGPGVRALVIALHRDSGMTESAITRFLTTHGIAISNATVSRMLTEGHEGFHEEKTAIVTAGLQTTRYQHIDDTSCRVKGKNHVMHILCNPFYTAYFTKPHKDRLSVLDVIRCEAAHYTFNQAAYHLMFALGLPKKWVETLMVMPDTFTLTQSQMDTILTDYFSKMRAKHQRILLEACALTYYKSLPSAFECLVCDDAPKFNSLTEHKALCWIHEGRHYKKLNPVVPLHQDKLNHIIDRFWGFYAALKHYQQQPTPDAAGTLSEAFESLFSTKTGYDALDDRLEKTLSKKDSLLLVLNYPFLPLHNNPAELGARVQARMRDIHYQTVSDDGTQAKDTFATILQTARKLGVNTYQYLYDRVSQTFKMPALADVIVERAGLIPNTS